MLNIPQGCHSDISVVIFRIPVDSTRAGPGSVTVEVMGPRSKSQPKVVADGNNNAEVTFRTIEGGAHMIKVFFNGIAVPGKLQELIWMMLMADQCNISPMTREQKLGKADILARPPKN